MVFSNDFEGPRGPKLHNFGSGGRLFRRPKIDSDFTSILDAKSDEKGIIWDPFWPHFEVENRAEKTMR